MCIFVVFGYHWKCVKNMCLYYLCAVSDHFVFQEKTKLINCSKAFIFLFLKPTLLYLNR